MLRHGAARLLLPQQHQQLLGTAAAAAAAGALPGALLGASSGGGWAAATQQLQQARHRSDAAGAAGDASSFVHDPIDATAAQLVEQADTLMAVSSAATEAAVAAAQGSVWAGTRAFIDLLMWTHDSVGLPWCARSSCCFRHNRHAGRNAAAWSPARCASLSAARRAQV